MKEHKRIRLPMTSSQADKINPLLGAMERAGGKVRSIWHCNPKTKWNTWKVFFILAGEDYKMESFNDEPHTIHVGKAVGMESEQPIPVEEFFTWLRQHTTTQPKTSFWSHLWQSIRGVK